MESCSCWGPALPLPSPASESNLASLRWRAENERGVFIPERVGSSANVPLYSYVGGSQPHLLWNF